MLGFGSAILYYLVTPNFLALQTSDSCAGHRDSLFKLRRRRQKSRFTPILLLSEHITVKIFYGLSLRPQSHKLDAWATTRVFKYAEGGLEAKKLPRPLYHNVDWHIKVDNYVDDSCAASRASHCTCAQFQASEPRQRHMSTVALELA